MLSLHQLRCFLAAYELQSFTAAAEELGYAQPTLSEQVRLLERTLGTTLFRRGGRGVVPTEAAEALRPHAERTLAEADAARKAVAATAALETGTVRFGVFGSARLYLGATLVADVLERHPGLRVELVGQNSTVVREDLRRGRLEAALIVLPVAAEGMAVRPVARDEQVYVSAHPERLRRPASARRLAEAPLVLAETSWRTEDPARVSLSRMVQQEGLSLQPRVEVEDVETAIELVGRGMVDTVGPRAVLDDLLPRLAPGAGWVPLRPRLYETIAVVHREDAVLSPGARLMIELATRRIRSVTDPVVGPVTEPTAEPMADKTAPSAVS
ncbi:MAG TPA: LysR family transcriptional regulator [Jiangellales bacterium]|nr:LysR family transcriptional regulator [Jiangellales bacterium]